MADTIYIYNRDKDDTDGHYLIENPARVDGGGDQIYLVKEIEAAFPGKYFKVKLDGNTVSIAFLSDSLTAAEKTTLDQVVQDHIDNAP